MLSKIFNDNVSVSNTLDDMKKAAQDHQWTFEECQQKMGEDQQRDQVHTILNALKKAYTMLRTRKC